MHPPGTVQWDYSISICLKVILLLIRCIMLNLISVSSTPFTCILTAADMSKHEDALQFNLFLYIQLGFSKDYRLK